MPASRDVGTNIERLKKNHPDWPMDKIKAVALEEARRMGNRKVKPAPSSVTKKKR